LLDLRASLRKKAKGAAKTAGITFKPYRVWRFANFIKRKMWKQMREDEFEQLAIKVKKGLSG